MNRSSRPVEMGKEYTVNITDIGRDGEGVARIGSLMIFVKNAKAGEKNIRIRINSVATNFATAEIAADSIYST
ncbi:MAG: TRAM domain-containing protein [Nitrososphaeraceae archaeon]